MFNTQQTAEKLRIVGFNYSADDIAELARQGVFKGATKSGNIWSIPENSIDDFIISQQHAREIKGSGMDWKQIVASVVAGAILSGAATFFVFQERISKSEAYIEQLQKQVEGAETSDRYKDLATPRIIEKLVVATPTNGDTPTPVVVEVTKEVPIEVTRIVEVTRVVTVVAESKSLPTSTPQPKTETYVLDLSKYDIGDIPREFGEGLIIGQRDGKNFVGIQNASASKTAKFEINDLGFTDNFEAVLDLDIAFSSIRISLNALSGQELVFKIEGQNLVFGKTSKVWNETGWGGDNSKSRVLRFVVDGDTAKLFINNEFFGTEIITPNETYHKLTIGGFVEKNAIFSIRISNMQK